MSDLEDFDQIFLQIEARCQIELSEGSRIGKWYDVDKVRRFTGCSGLSCGW